MQSNYLPSTYSSQVFHGNKTGRQINFPTVNLDPSVVPLDTPQGVYASKLEINGQKFVGALYFGPRLVKNETHNVLEIFILDFEKEIYGEIVEFSLSKFIRPVLNFKSLQELKLQLEKDVAAVRSSVTSQ